MPRTARTPLGWLGFPGLAATVLLLAATPTQAQTATFWVPTAGGNWFTASNWDAGLPNAAGAWSRFGYVTTASQTVTVDGTATVGRITFGFLNGTETATSNFAYTLTGGGITLNNGGSAAIVERSRTDGNSVIQTPLTIAGNNSLTLTNAGYSASGAAAQNTLTIGSLTGTNSTVTVNPSGTIGPGLVVIQSGNYGGITNVNGGTLRADEGIGLPANTSLRLNGGGWELTQPTTITRSLGTGAGQIQLLGTSAGFVAFNGLVDVRLNGGGQVQWGSANFNPTTLQFGRGVTAGGSDTYVFENGLDLNGAVRRIAVGVGSGGVRAVARLTGNIVNTSATASGLTVGGAGGGGGVVELSGANTYNGATTVNTLSTLRANDGAGLSPNSNLVLAGGILEGLGAATFARPLGTAPGSVRLTGTSGFSASGGSMAVQLNGGTGTVTWGGTADFNPSTLQFGSFTADALTDFRNGLDLNSASAARFVSVRDNTTSATDSARISGVISNSAGTGPVVFGGNGTLELTAANTYAGDTYLNDASVLPNTVVKLTGTGSFASSPTVTVGALRTLDVTGLTGGANYSAAANRFQLATGQTLAGSGTVVGSVLVGPTATIRGGSPSTGLNDPTGQLTVNGALRLSGSAFAAPATLAVDLNGTSASGATVSRVAVTGTGNAWDFDVTGGPVTLRLLNDQNLTPGTSYTYLVGSSAGGLTRNGAPVTSYAYGTDFTLASGTFPGFSGVSLAADGANNLMLTFTPAPVPEPGAVLAAGAAGLGLAGLARHRLRRGCGPVS
jgi:autotransporter-associated beta strand protein